MDRKYPIGKLEFKEDYTGADIAQWVSEIESLPKRLKEEIKTASETILNTPYREGSWTVRQVVNHLADSHMNGIVRIKLALSEDKPTIRPFYRDGWVKLEDKFETPLKLSLSFLENCHAKLVLIYKSLNGDDWDKSFLHPENGEITLARTAALYAWHGNHHLAHIRLVTQNI